MTFKSAIEKKHSFKWHIQQLDKFFSIYIRIRNADENGYVKCFTCGKIAHWKEMHCGHYVGRKHLALRFDEKNCQVQCPACNLFMEGNKDEFSVNLEHKYGIGILRNLNLQKHSKSKIGIIEMRILIQYYQKKNESKHSL